MNCKLSANSPGNLKTGLCVNLLNSRFQALFNRPCCHGNDQYLTFNLMMYFVRTKCEFYTGNES